MKIKEIRIDGFGHFNEEDFGPLNPSIVIFHGENEAGKSTILNFIRTTLFGFPTRGRDDHYPPVNGGQHGGRLVVTGSDEVDYIVERYVGSKGGNVKVTGMDGSTYPVSKLRELTGHASKDVFENIFAFSLDELQSSDILDDENVNSQIYSAGMGVTNLPSLLDKLQAQMNRLYRPRGSVGVVNKCAAELDEIDKQIRELTKNSEQYSSHRNQADKADETKIELQGEKVKAQKRLTRLTAMKDAWPFYIKLITLRQELEQFPEFPDMPINPIAKLESLLGTQDTAQQEFTNAEVDTSSAKMEYEEIHVDELIIANENAIEDISQRKSSFLNSIKDLPERIAELSGLTKLVDETIKTLGEGWNAERLKSTDLDSIPVSIEIDGHRDNISGDREKVLIEENTVAERGRDFEQLKSDLDSANSEFSKLPEPALDPGRLTQASKFINDLESSKNILDTLQTNSLPEPDSNYLNDFISEKGLPLALFIGGLIFSIFLFMNKEPILGSSFILIATISLIWLLKLQFLPSKARSTVQQSTNQTISNLEISIEENINSLKTMGLPGESISDSKKTIASISAESDQKEKSYEKITSLEDQIGKSSHQLSFAKETLKSSRAKQKENQEQWRKWLSERDLPDVLTPIAMSDYLGQIKTGKERLLNAETMAERIDAINTDISEYASLVNPLAEKHDMDFDVNDNNSLLNIAESLLKDLNNERAKYSKKTQRLSDLKKCEHNLVKRTQNLETATQSINSLLEEASTDTIDQYRTRAEFLSKKIELESDLREQEIILQTSSGPGEKYKTFLLELSKTSIEEIDSALLEISSHVNEINIAHDQAVEEGAQANQLIDQLIDEDKLSSLQIEKTQLQEQLRENITLWTKLKIASEVLRKGRDKFQSERQPGVIKEAEAFLKTITSDRYKGMYAPIGGDELTVIDQSDFNKKPDQLSRGTKEQVFLSLRFGLIKEYGESIDTLPVIVDEVLVNFDPERALRSCSAFAELSDTNQIIVFTCHPEMVDAFKSASNNVQVISLGE